MRTASTCPSYCIPDPTITGLRHVNGSGPSNRTGVPDSIAKTCHLWHHMGMAFTRLVEIVGTELVWDTVLLLAGDVGPTHVNPCR